MTTDHEPTRPVGPPPDAAATWPADRRADETPTPRPPSTTASTTGPTRLRVASERPYDVVIGRDLLPSLPAMLPDETLRVAVIHPASLRRPAATLRTMLGDRSLIAHTVEVPDGEAAKTSDVAAYCWRVLGDAGFTRSDLVIGLGGGATTDLAGFVAATWLRGVNLVTIPTTLLGMVDAAIGGKTGINTDAGKNLVGAFHEPVGVLCDLGALSTLPVNEVRSGLAEVVKCGFVADPAILDLIERGPEAALDVGGPVVRELVERAVRVKADVVAGDLRETSGSAGGAVGREALNYGHTLGHAVERVERYAFRHGAAVAIGMCFVAELAHRVGRLDRAVTDRHREVLQSVGLPTSYRPGAWEQLHEAMRLDKKARGAELRFVVLDGLASPGLLAGPGESDLTAAYAAISR